LGGGYWEGICAMEIRGHLEDKKGRGVF
jgi:hypothetical protein